MEAILKSESRKIHVLYAHNDDMAIGAIQAIEEAGLKPGKDILIVSIDAVKGAFEAMIAGKLNATIECNPLARSAADDVGDRSGGGHGRFRNASSSRKPCSPWKRRSNTSRRASTELPCDERPAIVLRARDISRAFPGVQALSGVELTLRAGEVHALMGQNGAGKSTLIKVLTGVYAPDAGSIELLGNAVTPQLADSCAAPRHQRRAPGKPPAAESLRGRKHLRRNVPAPSLDARRRHRLARDRAARRGVVSQPRHQPRRDAARGRPARRPATARRPWRARCPPTRAC